MKRLTHAAAACAVLAALAACGGGADGTPTVTGTTPDVVVTTGDDTSPTRRETTLGTVIGSDDSATRGTHAWKGIPYAKAPVGALRWKAPADADAWAGSRITQQFGNACASTQDRSSLEIFLESTIGAVTSYDQKRGTELTTTLSSYFDCNQNAKMTAQKLGIHVNTMRQRLATIEELLGHFGNATRALEIHVALRLWHLGGGIQIAQG